MTTTIMLADETKDELNEHKIHKNESYSDVIDRLLSDSDAPTFGVTAEEAEDIAERVTERKIEELAR